MNRTITQEGSFKAGEYGELVIVGQPMVESVFFDFYPKGVYGEPPEAPHKEEGPPLGWPPIEQSWTPSPEGGGADGSASPSGPSVVVPAGEPQREQAEEPQPEGLTEAFAEPRMALYYSNSPRDGWKRIGEFKTNTYTDIVRKARFYRLIHPKNCPFEGQVVVTGKTL